MIKKLIESSIIDEDNNKHELYSKYYFNNKEYFITEDKKIFTKENENYIEISPEESLDVLNDYSKIKPVGDIIISEEKDKERE